VKLTELLFRYKLASAAAAVVVAGASTAAVMTIRSNSSGSGAVSAPTDVHTSPGTITTGLTPAANGSATITWSAPTSGQAVTGYLVDLDPTYTDRVPKPDLGPNGGTQEHTVPASARSDTFTGLYQDCHQRYQMSVRALTADGQSEAVSTSSFRPSGYVVPNQDPPYVVVLADGIDSVQPGFEMNPYQPNTGSIQSYCPESWNADRGVEEEADFAKPDGLAAAGDLTGPWSFFHKWSHGETDKDGNPTTGASGGPNLLYASEPKLLGGPMADGGPGSFTHTFMLDEIAAQGAIILPFSYHSNLDCIESLSGNLDGIGAQVKGTAQTPIFKFPAYDKSDSDPIPFVNDAFQPCRGNITYWSQILGAELRSVHETWPTSKLVVMGHSQGGLVVATAWQHGFALNTSDRPVDIQAFSLDSPINGVCAVHPGCLGPPSYPDYDKRGTFDEGSGGYLGMDQSRGNNMHFIGTYGDSPAIPIPIASILKFADLSAPDQLNYAVSLKAYGTGAETLEHQMPFWYSTQDPPAPNTYTSDYVEANCTVQSGAVMNPQCPVPEKADDLSTCPVDYYTVAQWITDTGHFVVKYCTGVVTFFNETLGLTPTLPTSSSPTRRPTYACTKQTFVDALYNPNGNEVVPVGAPRCQDSYAVMDFAPYPGGQQEPFFFEFTADRWSLIEGGDAVPTEACKVMPQEILAAWGSNCPSASAERSSRPASSSAPSTASGVTSITAARYRYSVALTSLTDTVQDGGDSAPPGDHFLTATLRFTNLQADRSAPFPPSLQGGSEIVVFLAVPRADRPANDGQQCNNLFPRTSGDLRTMPCRYVPIATLSASASVSSSPDTIAAGQSISMVFRTTVPDSIPDRDVSAWVYTESSPGGPDDPVVVQVPSG
jgi:hypothetical protein